MVIHEPTTRLRQRQYRNAIAVPGFMTLGQRVMTRSTLGPEPIPAPAQPQTDPRCFITDMPRVASRHVTCSRRAHLQTCASASRHARPLVVCVFFLPAL